MPNWCEGKLKIRGKKSDLLKWLMECVACWKPDVIFGAKDERDIMVLPIQSAWAMDPTPYQAMSEKYNVDFRFYGYERGMEFNQEIEIIGGKLTIYREIGYSDYRWECPDPDLGG